MTPTVHIPQMQPQTECKVCGCQSVLYGVVDFTKSGNPNVTVQLSGIPIYYYQCEECNFLFTKAFDDWDMEAFSTHIYNENYALFDSGYLEARPRTYAQELGSILHEHKGQLKGLDYGGGNGLMASLMREQGFDYISWDPMGGTEPQPPSKHFNFVSAIEVAEHVPDPSSFFQALDDFLAPDGVCVFTTVTTDSAAGQNLMDWWYVGPINGHISLFSKAAIARMAHRHGMQVRHSNGLHILYREPSALLESTFTALELDPEDTIIGTSAACDIDS